MFITKTRFINYTRCPRYVALDNIHEEEKMTDQLYQHLQQLENNHHYEEMLQSMNEEGNNVVVDNANLEAMMPYYQEIEMLASRKINNLFKGTTIASKETKLQKCYQAKINKHHYLCYVDIYNQSNNNENIIEVKATTDKKYQDLEVFKLKDNIYYLDGCSEEIKNKLLDRYSDVGRYIYDLAVQRYIIENVSANFHQYHYYLAILNSKYVFDGTYQDSHPCYSDDIISIFNFDDLTNEYQKIITKEQIKLEKYLHDLDASATKLGNYCQYKKLVECKYFKTVCGKKIPSCNSSLCYLNNNKGFKDENKKIHKGLELINENYLTMEDIPLNWLTNPNHLIQRDCVINNKIYLDKKKIQDIYKIIKYPIYYLDFETFNCPLPRFYMEKCYSQSVFEFSLHIERKPGLCDKEQDNIVYLAPDFEDHRLDLVQTLLKYIKPGGTLLAQNISFERNRIKELASIYPEYHDKLLAILDNCFDLIYLLKGNSKIYEELGYSKKEAKIINYYHPHLSGSYSIKKTLPIFSDLSYDKLNIHNGMDAIVNYAKYPLMNKEELKKTFDDLKEYCKQDTWAMVLILNEIRKEI